MASGGRDIGSGRPTRQLQMQVNYHGSQNVMRGIQQGMKQLQVSGQGGLSAEGQPIDRQQAMGTPWTVTNLTPDKRSTRHAKALREIRHSLQSYEVGGDVDRAELDRCIELGFDEDISREVLRANKDKDFSVVLTTLMSLTSVSGRKAVKSIAPGTLQSARNTTPGTTAIPTSRASQLPQGQKMYGSQPPLAWNQISPVPTSVNSVYIKSAAIPNARLENRSALRRQAVDTAIKGQVVTGQDPFRVDRGQFIIGERKTQDMVMNNYPEVRLRHNRPTNRDSQKRWSADVLQKTKAFELPNKRNSLAFEVGDRRSPFDVPNKPPPPYPGYAQNHPQQDLRFDQWSSGKIMPSNGNMKRIASMETVSKIGTESPRLNSPITIVTDNRKQFLNGNDVKMQDLQSQEVSAFQNVGLNTHFAPREPPPPYHSGLHRPLQRTYSPNDRGSHTLRMGSNTNVNQTANQVVYPYNQTSDAQLMPPEVMQEAFIPIHSDSSTENYYNGSQNEASLTSRASPPPYPGLEHRYTTKEKRFSYASDVDSGTSSKRASAIFADGSTQSDSSGSTSPTPETIESRCSPLPLTSSPYHTLVIHSSDREVKNEEEQVEEEPFNRRLKVCSSQAYKFFMEQHVENVLKLRQMREKRRKQLEIEMSRYGLSEESQTEMRKMLVQKESNHIRMKRSKMTRSMFSKIKTLGMGAFGEVALVRKIDANALYAMKILRKADVIRRNQVAHVKAERDILAEADNEWVVKLYYSFQDSDNLYFVMEYVPGGDLMALLIKQGIFSEELGQFYTAELVLAVESVHKMGFIHRDIKPDNVLIDRNGHIKLTDFGLCTGFRWTHDSKYYQDDPNHARQPSMEPEGGWENVLNNGQCDCGDVIKKFDLCKPLDRRAARQHMRCLAHSLVGTPNYIAPEVLLRIPYTQLCDWWSVGVILYEMLVGQPPFLARSPAETQMKVVHWQNTLKIPHHAKLSDEAENLIQRLCTGPENRIGRMGTDEIKKHPFFGGVDWANCLKNKPPPYIPKIKHATDTSNFDPVPEKETENEADEAYEEEKQRILDKAPQHAFYEFTFRRFFDEGGHPQTFGTDEESKGERRCQPSDTTSQNNKRTVTTSDKSVPVPSKVAAPPINYGRLDEKAPIYV